MTLYLLRHAEAEDIGLDLNDVKRGLTTVGRQQSELAGKSLATLKIVPDLIFCSPLLRAQQTAEIAAAQIGLHKIVQVTPLLVPDASRREFLTWLHKENFSGQDILMVGHEPFMSRLTSLLISGDERCRIQFKKCALARLDVEKTGFPGHATLKWLLIPEQQERLAQARR